MSQKNKSMYAILGILSLSPASGYDIKKYSDTVLSGFWNENFGHIYPTLKKMQQAGLIEGASASDYETKVRYSITEKGRQALSEWLTEDTIPQPVRSEFMLKLLFSSNQPKERVIEMLTNYRALLETKLAQYRQMLSNLEAGVSEIAPERTRYLRVILRNGILSREAGTKWCNETIAEFQNS